VTITAASTIRDIAREHPSTVRVFEKEGIDYCCGGAKSLETVCGAKNLEVAALIARLEQSFANIADDEDTPESASLSDVIDHIIRRHHHFVRTESARVEALIAKVVSRHGDGEPQLKDLQATFDELTQELSSHMMKEEQVLFPYVVRLENAVSAGEAAPPAFFGTVKNPVRTMMSEHENAGALLARIRELTGNFVAPEHACPTYRAMLAGLEDFERDLHRHVHLENNILFPRAVELESSPRVANVAR
jgi:regulator of cell morphogenesis and NO signaling